jgi:hypothetical protein
MSKVIFDYTNQAWTSDGVYLDCAHYPAGTILGPGGLNSGKVFQGCDCYGRAHAGEAVSAEIIAEQDERERSVITSNNGVRYATEDGTECVNWFSTTLIKPGPTTEGEA